jgi:hypothetical protein
VLTAGVALTETSLPPLPPPSMSQFKLTDEGQMEEAVQFGFIAHELMEADKPDDAEVKVTVLVWLVEYTIRMLSAACVLRLSSDTSVFENVRELKMRPSQTAGRRLGDYCARVWNTVSAAVGEVDVDSIAVGTVDPAAVYECMCAFRHFKELLDKEGIGIMYSGESDRSTWWQTWGVLMFQRKSFDLVDLMRGHPRKP